MKVNYAASLFLTLFLLMLALPTTSMPQANGGGSNTAPAINMAVCISIGALFVGVGIGIGVGALIFRRPYGYRGGVGIWYGKRRKREASPVDKEADEEAANINAAIEKANELYE